MWKRVCVGMCTLMVAGCAAGTGSGGTGIAAKPLKGKPLRIGVIVPLSGEYGLYGRSTLHGIECAAGTKAPCEARFPIELVVRDSDGDPAKTAQAVRELAAEKVAAIIGPLVSKTADAAAQEAQVHRIPLISLTQKSSVADVGPYIYSVGMDAESQAKTIATYAVAERGLKRIAIAYPQNTFGHLFRDLFRAAATQLGATITAERGYTAGLGDIIEARKRAKVDEASMAENSARRQYQLSTSGEVMEQSSAYTPLPQFSKLSGSDAVFIPDSYRSVIGMLDTYGDDVFGRAVLLGVNRWNSRGILSGGSAVEGALFVDGFFKNSSNVETQRFVTLFTQAYGEEPTILEAQAYDALQVVALAAGRGDRDAAYVQDRLQRMKKYQGVTGHMTFTPTGRADKELFVLTVQHGDITEVGSRSSKRKLMSLQSAPPATTQQAARRVGNEKYEQGGSAQNPNHDTNSWDKYSGDI